MYGTDTYKVPGCASESQGAPGGDPGLCCAAPLGQYGGDIFETAGYAADPGRASRPLALMSYAFGVHRTGTTRHVRRRRYTPKPRVATRRTLGHRQAHPGSKPGVAGINGFRIRGPSRARPRVNGFGARGPHQAHRGQRLPDPASTPCRRRRILRPLKHSLRQRRYTSEPRVAQRTLGPRSAPWVHAAHPESTQRTLGPRSAPWVHAAHPGSTQRTLGLRSAPWVHAAHPGSTQRSLCQRNARAHAPYPFGPFGVDCPTLSSCSNRRLGTTLIKNGRLGRLSWPAVSTATNWTL
jgi:hypothetical protein